MIVHRLAPASALGLVVVILISNNLAKLPQGRAFAPQSRASLFAHTTRERIIKSRTSVHDVHLQLATSPRRGSDEPKSTDGASFTNSNADATTEPTNISFESNSGKEVHVMYNAVPLFTGSVVMILSLLGTGYMFYAGLTGDDPLMGHPK